MDQGDPVVHLDRSGDRCCVGAVPDLHLNVCCGLSRCCACDPRHQDPGVSGRIVIAEDRLTPLCRRVELECLGGVDAKLQDEILGPPCWPTVRSSGEILAASASHGLGAVRKVGCQIKVWGVTRTNQRRRRAIDTPVSVEPVGAGILPAIVENRIKDRASDLDCTRQHARAMHIQWSIKQNI